MQEIPKNSQDIPLSKNNLDILAVHPQIQTRYIQNIESLAKQWNNRFVIETTMQLNGKSYGKNENGKLTPDFNADFLGLSCQRNNPTTVNEFV